MAILKFAQSFSTLCMFAHFIISQENKIKFFCSFFSIDSIKIIFLIKNKKLPSCYREKSAESIHFFENKKANVWVVQ